MMLTRTGA